jgi:hypothetical protein
MRGSVKAFVYCVMVAGIVGLQGLARSAPNNDVALAFSRGFVDGYVRSAVKRGEDPQQSKVEGQCIYDVLSSRLTLQDWVDLVAALNEATAPPKRIAPTLRQASSQCLQAEGNKRAVERDQTGQPSISVQWDRADAPRLAREMRRLRVAEEWRRRQTEGHAIPLPTGTCTADATVDERGLVGTQLSIHCSDDSMREFMRDAVLASEPLHAPAGSTVRLGVVADDPEPVDSPESMSGSMHAH